MGSIPIPSKQIYIGIVKTIFLARGTNKASVDPLKHSVAVFAKFDVGNNPTKKQTKSCKNPPPQRVEQRRSGSRRTQDFRQRTIEIDRSYNRELDGSYFTMIVITFKKFTTPEYQATQKQPQFHTHSEIQNPHKSKFYLSSHIQILTSQPTNQTSKQIRYVLPQAPPLHLLPPHRLGSTNHAMQPPTRTRRRLFRPRL